MPFFLSAVGLSAASALAVRFGLRGSLWVGGAIGLVLFYGVALPLLARFEGEYWLTDPTSFFLTMGAFAIASAALGVLAVLSRHRKILLVLGGRAVPADGRASLPLHSSPGLGDSRWSVSFPRPSF